MLRSVCAADAAAICEIYNHYIEKTTISFEEMPLEISAMQERILGISGKYPYLVWEDDNAEGRQINGYAYINTWKERSAYRFSAEISVYVRHGFEGRGTGRLLMENLLKEVRKTSIHSIVAGITLPNDRSIALHEKFGFKKIAQFEEIGKKFNKWLDVGYWELLL